MQKEKFILCPVCGNKTRVQIREDTGGYRAKEFSPVLSQVP